MRRAETLHELRETCEDHLNTLARVVESLSAARKRTRCRGCAIEVAETPCSVDTAEQMQSRNRRRRSLPAPCRGSRELGARDGVAADEELRGWAQDAANRPCWEGFRRGCSRGHVDSAKPPAAANRALAAKRALCRGDAAALPRR